MQGKVQDCLGIDPDEAFRRVSLRLQMSELVRAPPATDRVAADGSLGLTGSGSGGTRVASVDVIPSSASLS